jgi:hypothetical protein
MTDPPATTLGPALRIVRTPTTGQLTAAVTSSDLLGCCTHFYQHHTIPCEAPDCPACAEGIGWRWHGWVSCILSTSQEHILFEFTAEASDSLRRYRDTHGTLRGCILTANRVAPRQNARVVIRTRPSDPAKLQLPPQPDISAALSHIWGIPPEQTKVRHRIKDSPAVGIHREIPITSNPNGDHDE